MSRDFEPETPGGPPARFLAMFLFSVLAVRLVFHAFYVPAFEGPDEPFHLARAAVFADGSFSQAAAGDRVPGSIVGAIHTYPCAPDLRRSFDCPPFAGTGAFNVLVAGSANRVSTASYPNYEAHQPPLFYAAAGALLRLFPMAGPPTRLLFVRLLCVFSVLLAIALPLRRIVGSEYEIAVVGLLFGLLPGGAEALARCSNDAAVFSWAALVLERTLHRARAWLVVALLSIGPLLKLTAFPVVAVVVTILWLSRRRVAAVAGAIASMLVVAVQAMRGWRWGGSLELNAPKPAIAEPYLEATYGFLRSAYTFVKTVFWLGEWSFFRAPVVLVAVWFAILGVLALLAGKTLRRAGNPLPDVAGFAVAAGSCVVFAIFHRRVFGQWGGLGGYYAWSWAPWMFVALRPTFRVPGRRWVLALAGFVVFANLFWFRSAITLYGP